MKRCIEAAGIAEGHQNTRSIKEESQCLFRHKPYIQEQETGRPSI